MHIAASTDGLFSFSSLEHYNERQHDVRDYAATKVRRPTVSQRRHGPTSCKQKHSWTVRL